MTATTTPPARWTVGAVIEWPAGDFRPLLVMSAHGPRAVLYDASGGAESFIPAEAWGEEGAGDWSIVTPDECGLPDYAAALAAVLES
jgi:hypothetical protein